jgi:hypothetical protein
LDVFHGVVWLALIEVAGVEPAGWLDVRNHDLRINPRGLDKLAVNQVEALRFGKREISKKLIMSFDEFGDLFVGKVGAVGDRCHCFGWLSLPSLATATSYQIGPTSQEKSF